MRHAIQEAEIPKDSPVSTQALLFVPVRPDWRDSKSLLGYYNPLTSTYQWTEFLRFLQRAERSYQKCDGHAWFVILDEMNLAHVEYYFADLLSVMESGRDQDGWTREPLRFQYPEDAEGDLPPNLYIVGTVNVDETTHAFSPKVLDRAFTIEFTEVDFSSYPLEPEEATPLSDGERQALLSGFTQEGQFRRVDKKVIADYVSTSPTVGERLQSLNTLLRTYNLHFGYRVFDEIAVFMANAVENEMFSGLPGLEPALDAAVLMKVLPKFHGSRSKLEAPLRDVLAWCANPDQPDREQITEALNGAEGAADLVSRLRTIEYVLPTTAARAGRMLHALYTDGFAAFG